MFSSSRRKHASQILIVITASRSSGNVRSYGASMKMNGVSIFSFGIGRSNKNELRSISSSPQFCMFNWNFRKLRRRQIIQFLSNLNNGMCNEILCTFSSIYSHKCAMNSLKKQGRHSLYLKQIRCHKAWDLQYTTFELICTLACQGLVEENGFKALLTFCSPPE